MRGSVASSKRTDLLLCVPAGSVRMDFFAGGWRVDDEGRGGLVGAVMVVLVLVAWAKSSARAGSLGWVRVLVVAGEEKPWNWEVRSSNWCCRLGRESLMVAAFLLGRAGQLPSLAIKSIHACMYVCMYITVIYGGGGIMSYVSSPASSRRCCSFCSASSPSRNWSSDRDI